MVRNTISASTQSNVAPKISIPTMDGTNPTANICTTAVSTSHYRVFQKLHTYNGEIQVTRYETWLIIPSEEHKHGVSENKDRTIVFRHQGEEVPGG